MAIMISKNLKCSSYRFVVVLLLLGTLLTSIVGRVHPVYALADPVDIAPIYETTIYQFQDYVENTLTESQGDIFYIMLGMYLAAQAGSSQYELYNPHTSEGGLLNWLKDCGIQLYNSVILKAAQPDLILGQDIRPAMSALVAYYMGVAVKASQYNSVQDFLNDVNASEKYCLPLTPDSMFNMNLLFRSYGGLGEWQNRVSPFTANVSYNGGVVPPTLQSGYYSALDSVGYLPIVRFNFLDTNGNLDSSFNNIRSSSYYLTTFHNLFINTTDMKYYFYDDYGNLFPYSAWGISVNNLSDSIMVRISSGSSFSSAGLPSLVLSSRSIPNFGSFVSFQDMTQYIYNTGGFYSSNGYIWKYFTFYEDFVDHVYYGADWSSRHEILNTSDLDLVDLASPYFLQPTQEILLDIKGLLNDLLNNTDLRTPFLNNIYLPDFTPVDIDNLLKVSIDAIIEALADPPIPVNLNDIAEYTQNDYLDELKEHAQDFGETIGEYVAFWHNSNYEITYVLLGSIIIIMIGAFIGKWGHS